jgi:uncharacterized protein
MRFLILTLAASALSLTQPAMAQRLESPTFDMVTSDSDTASPILTLSITGQASAKPDMAIISGGVQSNSPNAAQAMKDNNRKMAAVIAAVRAAGVAEKDIQTAGIGLGRQYDYDENGKRVDRGFQATNSVNVRIRKIDDLGVILQAMVDSGANDVNGPSFSIDDDSSLTAAARAQAISKAEQLSASYAKQLGFSKAMLFHIVEGQESGLASIDAAKFAVLDAAEGGAVPVQAGEVTKTVSIAVKYRLIK